MHNKDNLFVNLSHIVLNRIIREFDDDLDIICFSLVCKRWFDNRHKYLSFNCKTNELEQECKLNAFTMNSYRNIFIKSIDQKIYKDTLFITQDIIDDTHQNNESFKDFDIPKSFVKLECLAWFDLNEFSVDKLSKSNVKSIRFFPDRQDEFRNDICLPSNIESLYFPFSINLSILPLDLKKLEIIIELESKIDFSLLPRSLKVLKITGGTFKKGQLPPNLVKFSHRLSTYEEKDMVLFPSTLKQLRISTNCLENINLFQSLRTLNLKIPRRSTLEFGMFPENLTHLKINNVYVHLQIKREMIPPNIKRKYIFVIGTLGNIRSLKIKLYIIRRFAISFLWCASIEFDKTLPSIQFQYETR
ncbi:hypothetical protein PPL_06904 [Heterostelium album PN500]|uniref:COI1 F-box domain-containing protein n=1 Tax=Heterostelium pallidum (strain ATCC 26659 / Pp 5 / PN500) TaxID=670386 RepID=D3BDV1_HETP5|nr:hypothetical protein PPL_06904 [Heterostelium album PN500]EFA80082.1 hypothetical protein PPL_06904 [Heterostelium album PN500]|eukprot:XP_020432202.1 hypothetical protein PPL_06904 [Heterostelium album PN500]